MAKPVLVYMKFGAFSFTNESVRRQLLRAFPEFDLVVLDIAEMIRARSWILPVNSVPLALEYGRQIVLEGRNHQFPRWITSFMFRCVRREVARRLAQLDDIAFTFQTQSLFDCHQPGLPHFVYTDHTVLTNLQYPEYRSVVENYSRAWRRLEPMIYQNATVVMTMSSHVTRSLVEEYGLDPGRISCVGVGSNAYRDSEPPVALEARAGSDHQNILFVGNNWELKGGPELVAAFRIVRQACPEARLTIVGTSPDIADEGVDVVGRVPLEAVGEHYARASVFCMPTKGDAFGIVFLEAYMNAVPVVAWDIGALPDIVDDGRTGYLVPYGDVEALADRLIRLLQDPEHCRELGRRGSAAIRSRYTWDHVGDRMREVITPHLDRRSLPEPATP